MTVSKLLRGVSTIADRLEDTYRDLHAHPELSFSEHRTSAIVAERMSSLGYTVSTGIGGTGVIGVLSNGDGPTVMLRADMDGLPVLEETGLDYASTDRGVDPDSVDVPVMHACGHDMHVSCLLGAAELLVDARDLWSGTIVAVFQPAEEVGVGAQAMIDGGLLKLVPRPDVVLGQHVAPAPAGILGLHAGPAFAAADGLRVTMFGRGGHGSRPETVIDPVVMAAATVLRLQTVVSREVAAGESVVLTVGQLHSGTKNNIVPDSATLGLSIRSNNAVVRERVLTSIHRIVEAEAAASGATQAPEILHLEAFPAVVNDVAASARTTTAFHAAFGAESVMDPGAVTGSEDVGTLATAADAPLVFWLLGGADQTAYATAAAAGTVERDIASNHSPRYAPVIRPTLDRGIAALAVAAVEWLDAPRS
jgi:amidohydrolase